MGQQWPVVTSHRHGAAAAETTGRPLLPTTQGQGQREPGSQPCPLQLSLAVRTPTRPSPRPRGPQMAQGDRQGSAREVQGQM